MAHACAVSISKLVEAGDSHIHVACAKCGRGGRYNIERLLREHVELSPMGLLERITSGCERRVANDPRDPCTAVYALL
jgi:hypothetical protein